jgi:hypothetical protein
MKKLESKRRRDKKSRRDRRDEISVFGNNEAKDFLPLRIRRMMVCRSSELHKDDIVGVGFARPHTRPNDELHIDELHIDDMFVGAKNLLPSPKLGCYDRILPQRTQRAQRFTQRASLAPHFQFSIFNFQLTESNINN